MPENYAMDTAARFGEIPFTDFTRDLITGTFEALLDAELKQLEAYTNTVSVLATDLSTYINNTHDDIPLADVNAFVQSLNLPAGNEVTDLTNALTNAWSAFQASGTTPATTASSSPAGTISGTVLSQILGALPAVSQTVLQLLQQTNGTFPQTVTLNQTTTPPSGTTIFGQTVAGAIPNYNIIYKAIAGKIANDKYSLLQNMVSMGMLRLVVDSGLVESRITFNTYESSSNVTQDRDRTRDVQRSSTGLIGALLNRRRRRQVTVTTAKAEHRDAQGSSVQIFGRVQINFKSDYKPLASAR